MSSLSPVQPPTPAHFTMPILRSKDVLTNLPKALCLQLIQLITKTEIQPPPTHTHYMDTSAFPEYACEYPFSFFESEVMASSRTEKP